MKILDMSLYQNVLNRHELQLITYIIITVYFIHIKNLTFCTYHFLYLHLYRMHFSIFQSSTDRVET